MKSGFGKETIALYTMIAPGLHSFSVPFTPNKANPAEAISIVNTSGAGTSLLNNGIDFYSQNNTGSLIKLNPQTPSLSLAPGIGYYLNKSTAKPISFAIKGKEIISDFSVDLINPTITISNPQTLGPPPTDPNTSQSASSSPKPTSLANPFTKVIGTNELEIIDSADSNKVYSLSDAISANIIDKTLNIRTGLGESDIKTTDLSAEDIEITSALSYQMKALKAGVKIRAKNPVIGNSIDVSNIEIEGRKITYEDLDLYTQNLSESEMTTEQIQMMGQIDTAIQPLESEFLSSNNQESYGYALNGKILDYVNQSDLDQYKDLVDLEYQESGEISDNPIIGKARAMDSLCSKLQAEIKEDKAYVKDLTFEFDKSWERYPATRDMYKTYIDTIKTNVKKNYLPCGILQFPRAKGHRKVIILADNTINSSGLYSINSSKNNIKIKPQGITDMKDLLLSILTHEIIHSYRGAYTIPGPKLDISKYLIKSGINPGPMFEESMTDAVTWLSAPSIEHPDCETNYCNDHAKFEYNSILEKYGKLSYSYESNQKNIYSFMPSFKNEQGIYINYNYGAYFWITRTNGYLNYFKTYNKLYLQEIVKTNSKNNRRINPKKYYDFALKVEQGKGNIGNLETSYAEDFQTQYNANAVASMTTPFVWNKFVGEPKYSPHLAGSYHLNDPDNKDKFGIFRPAQAGQAIVNELKFKKVLFKSDNKKISFRTKAPDATLRPYRLTIKEEANLLLGGMACPNPEDVTAKELVMPMKALYEVDSNGVIGTAIRVIEVDGPDNWVGEESIVPSRLKTFLKYKTKAGRQVVRTSYNIVTSGNQDDNLHGVVEKGAKGKISVYNKDKILIQQAEVSHGAFYTGPATDPAGYYLVHYENEKGFRLRTVLVNKGQGSYFLFIPKINECTIIRSTSYVQKAYACVNAENTTVEAFATGDTTANISIKTAEPSTPILYLGTDPNNLEEIDSDAYEELSYVYELNSLEPRKKYYYKLDFIDENQEIYTTEVKSFSLLPTISNVTVDIDATSAMLQWTMDPAGKVRIRYGKTSGLESTPIEIDYPTDGKYIINNLEPGITYYYLVEPIDKKPNCCSP